MKTFCVWLGVISKSHDSQIVRKCEFWKWGTTFQIGILHVLLNTFNIATAKGTWHVWLFRDAKGLVKAFHVLKKINKMQVAG